MARSSFHSRLWGYDQYGDDINANINEPKDDISHISIVTKGDAIESFCFSSSDDNLNLGVLSLFGRKRGLKRAKIDIIIRNEKIAVISGTFDIYESRKIITSLSFLTDNNKSYGPFGTTRGTAFALVVKDHSFTNLGAHCGWLLDDTGVSLGNRQFTITESIKPFGGPGGENQYDYMAKGEITRIYIKHEGGIRSIRFTSQNEKGGLRTSRRIGGAVGDKGNKTTEIVLDTNNNEKLVGISGTVGIYLSFLVITSLKFYTSANRSFGPFGGGAGDPFSYMAEEGYITGFYGRDGGLLDSIGLHVQVIPNLDLLAVKEEPQCE